MPTVQVRMAPPLHERFLQECERRDISPSDFIRQAVELMMDHIDTRAHEETEPWQDAKPVPLPTARIAPRPLPSDPKRLPSGVRGFSLDGGPMTQDDLQGRVAASRARRKKQ